ncbi:MAG: hypothetical protein HKN26_04205 [Acidimicrobiales bacterium]|nr:hypothetical protein [Acidimicrobiales bacterium]
MVTSRGDAVSTISTARRGAKRVLRTAREQALSGYGLVTGQAKPVRGDITPVELVLRPGATNWCVRRAGRLYSIDADGARQLSMLLPASPITTIDAIVGTASVTAPTGGVGRPSLELQRGDDVETVAIDPSAAAVLAPVTVAPQPYDDDWVQSVFSVTAESTERLDLHLYLPPNPELPPKRFLVLADGEEVGSGELARDAHSILAIDAAAPAIGRTFEVHLAYSDPSSESDHRQLGAVLKGVTKWLDPRAFR